MSLSKRFILSTLRTTTTNHTITRYIAPSLTSFSQRNYGAGYPHPTRAQALNRILEILSQHENVKVEPRENSTLEELGFDLLDRVEICHELEEQFGCRIRDDDGFNAESVADLTNLIVDHPNSKWYRM